MDHIVFGYLGTTKITTILDIDFIGVSRVRFIECEFVRIVTENPIFYDWYMVGESEIGGIEVHLTDCDNSEVFDLCQSYSLVDPGISPFPRLPIRDIFEGKEIGLEAFGDICLFTGSGGNLLVATPLTSWLDPSQVENVRNHCNHEKITVEIL